MSARRQSAARRRVASPAQSRVRSRARRRREPIFVVGSPRSGTSILTWSLGQHSNIFPVEESNWLAKLGVNMMTAHAFGSARGARSQLGGMRVSREEFVRTFGDAAFDLVLRKSRERIRPRRRPGKGAFLRNRAPGDPKRRWVDGTPEYSHHIVALRELFPDARFLHILRDARSTAVSMVNFDKVAQRSWDWNQAYAKWMSHVQACLAAERAFGSGTVLRVTYSDLTSDPEAAIGRCLSFLGESFDPACLIPLQTRKINSSLVEDPEAEFARRDVDPELERSAFELSDRVLSAPPQESSGSEAHAAALRREYFGRVASFERLYADRGSVAFDHAAVDSASPKHPATSQQ